MKKNLLNPGFEFVFGLGVIMMLMLPTFMMAQQPAKELKVIIENKDTTINGKNIKELSVVERKQALKDIAEVSKETIFTSTGNDANSVTYIRSRKRAMDGKGKIAEEPMNIMEYKNFSPSFKFRVDSTGKVIQEMYNTDLAKQMSEHTRNMRFSYDDKGDGPRTMIRMGGRGERNSQSFSYSNTNKDGINTHISYHVSDVNAETAKKISGIEKLDLSIDDLMLSPSFTTLKTNLGFTLAEKGLADVQLKDSDGKVLWTDKTNGSFYKSFDLPQNGIYYLKVKQGAKTGLRRIVKEQ